MSDWQNARKPKEGNCGLCEFWRPDGPDEWQWGQCGNVTLHVAQSSDDDADTWMLTAPDFGCVQWKAKE